MEAWLQTDDGRRFPFAGGCTIGRLPENTVALDDPGVSRRHALIHAHGTSGFWLMDFGSRNGVRLNKRRVNEPTRIADGDTIEIAGHRFAFHERNHALKPPGSGGNSAAWKTTESLSETFVPTGHGMILLTPDGKIKSLSALAQKCLAHYFRRANDGALPAEVSDWLRRERQLKKKSPGGPGGEMFSVEKDRKRLSIKIAE